MNVTLLLKWVWKLYKIEPSIRTGIIRAKYPDSNDILSGTSQGDSPFWRSFHNLKHCFDMWSVMGSCSLFGTGEDMNLSSSSAP
jgi:hypothetical protein